VQKKSGEESDEISEINAYLELTKLRIKIDPRFASLLKNRGMNWSVNLQEPFRFKPTPFSSEVDGLKPRAFSQRKQLRLFNEFLAYPNRPVCYCLASAPNDGQAKLLAAWMMQYMMNHERENQLLPLWHDLTGGFENKLIKDPVPCSLLVVNNVGPDSTPVKIEKLRDLLEVYSRIPRVVVVNGCDPYMFFTRFLRMPIHGLTYMANKSVKKALDI
jgi:hypothetical protein